MLSCGVTEFSQQINHLSVVQPRKTVGLHDSGIGGTGRNGRSKNGEGSGRKRKSVRAPFSEVDVAESGTFENTGLMVT